MHTHLMLVHLYADIIHVCSCVVDMMSAWSCVRRNICSWTYWSVHNLMCPGWPSWGCTEMADRLAPAGRLSEVSVTVRGVCTECTLVQRTKSKPMLDVQWSNRICMYCNWVIQNIPRISGITNLGYIAFLQTNFSLSYFFLLHRFVFPS